MPLEGMRVMATASSLVHGEDGQGPCPVDSYKRPVPTAIIMSGAIRMATAMITETKTVLR